MKIREDNQSERKSQNFAFIFSSKENQHTDFFLKNFTFKCILALHQIHNRKYYRPYYNGTLLCDC